MVPESLLFRIPSDPRKDAREFGGFGATGELSFLNDSVDFPGWKRHRRRREDNVN